MHPDFDFRIAHFWYCAGAGRHPAQP
jgi:hypothetical protein